MLFLLFLLLFGSSFDDFAVAILSSSTIPLSWFTHTHRRTSQPASSLSRSASLAGCGLCPLCVALHSKEEMRLPIEVIMDFDSPSRRRDAAVAVDCCGAALCRIAVLPYAVCRFFFMITFVVPFLRLLV